MLIERLPKDPPPPRRSKRSLPPDQEEDSKPPAKKGRPKSKSKQKLDDDPVETTGNTTYDSKIEVSSEKSNDSPHEKTPKGRTKRVARNVGGWVSPEFSSLVDRDWLETSESDTTKMSLTTYVPQPGETILYVEKSLHYGLFSL